MKSLCPQIACHTGRFLRSGFRRVFDQGAHSGARQFPVFLHKFALLTCPCAFRLPSSHKTLFRGIREQNFPRNNLHKMPRDMYMTISTAQACTQCASRSWDRPSSSRSSSSTSSFSSSSASISTSSESSSSSENELERTGNKNQSHKVWLKERESVCV